MGEASEALHMLVADHMQIATQEQKKLSNNKNLNMIACVALLKVHMSICASLGAICYEGVGSYQFVDA